MKGKINEFGNLSIERAGQLKLQLCPDGYGAACGDWCPLFHEPEHYQTKNQWTLDLCKTTLLFDEFVDERKKDASNISQSD